ncbi:MAG: metallophosphoesterase family protein [Fibrobacterota bacterium]
MKIGIVSDTHRTREFHEAVLHELLSEGVTKVYHLGDDYRDGELVIEMGMDLVRVPGLYCPEYNDRNVEKVQFDTVHGINIVMAHDLKDIPENDRLCNDIFLTGHTHKAEVRVENGKLHLNPGHLKHLMDKGRAPSYGLLDIDYGAIEARVLDLQGKTIARLSLKKGENGLYKV